MTEVGSAMAATHAKLTVLLLEGTGDWLEVGEKHDRISALIRERLLAAL